jgi:hypothetical protein
MKRLAALFVLLTFSPNLFAWGPTGHRIVARIAQAHLRDSTRLQIRDLLGNNDLAAISVWADEIKTLRPETASWHFVDIPINSSGFYEPRDCYRPNDKNVLASADHHNCVVDRIESFAKVLADRNASHDERVEALKFLVHFVGDVHQPLHAIAEARGGNDVHVLEFGSSQCGKNPCNLHFAWDIGLIEHTHRSESEYLAFLNRMISSRNLRGQRDGTPVDWANQSFHLAKQVWLKDGSPVDEAYYQKNIYVVDERLALAGLRLAALLNNVLGGLAQGAAASHEHQAAKR